MTIKKTKNDWLFDSEKVDPYLVIKYLRDWTKEDLKGTKIGNPHIHLGFVAAKVIKDLIDIKDAKEQYLRDIKHAIDTLRNM